MQLLQVSQAIEIFKSVLDPLTKKNVIWNYDHYFILAQNRAILQKLANVTLNKKIYLAELTFSYQ